VLVYLDGQTPHPTGISSYLVPVEGSPLREQKPSIRVAFEVRVGLAEDHGTYARIDAHVCTIRNHSI
jgi:hypothetical protein